MLTENHLQYSIYIVMREILFYIKKKVVLTLRDVYDLKYILLHGSSVQVLLKHIQIVAWDGCVLYTQFKTGFCLSL